jgi:mannose-6-phosphate isomerase-like protein (cupin superfamily)
MRIAKVEEEEGIAVPSPYDRTIKVLFAPDRRRAAEMTFSHVTIPPGGGTDMHEHDRPELIYIISGRAQSTSPDAAMALGPGTALWAEAGEMHELRNTGDEPLTIVTVFVPAYRAEQLYAACLARVATPRKEKRADVRSS